MDKINSLNLKSFIFPCISEDKDQGVLRVFEYEDIPFTVKRVFSVANAKGGVKRGQHAHKVCNQLINCIAGEVNLRCDDGNTHIDILLSSENEALLVPSGIWAEQDYLKDNSVIIVFCDQSYEENDYIRDYDAFIKWKKKEDL